MNTKLCIYLLFTIIHTSTFAYCEYAPFQRADADIPVHAGLASLPQNPNIIAHVVEYDTTTPHPIARDTKDPRLHTHIWLVDMKKCKKLLALPIPAHASINVHTIETDNHALPINRLDNGDLEIKYAFVIPEQPKVVKIRRAIINQKWQIKSQQDFNILMKKDARPAVSLADWQIDGGLIDLSEPATKTMYHHQTIKFNNDSVILFKYAVGHPEAHMTTEGMLFDDTKPFKAKQYYPRYALITSFDPSMRYYRQFTGKLPNPEKPVPHYLTPLEKNNMTLFQLGNQFIDSQGVIVSSGKPLDDYLGIDQLRPEHIQTYRWQDGKWVKDDALRPKRLMASDIINHHHNWPD